MRTFYTCCLTLQPLLTSRCDSDPVFYVHQGHLPTHMRSLRLSRYTDQRLTRHAPARARRLMVTGGVLALFLVSVLCFLLSLYYWGNKGYDAPPSLEDPESTVSTVYDKVSLILSVLLFNLSIYLEIYIFLSYMGRIGYIGYVKTFSNMNMYLEDMQPNNECNGLFEFYFK